jgi:hypothetical protein
MPGRWQWPVPTLWERRSSRLNKRQGGVLLSDSPLPLLVLSRSEAILFRIAPIGHRRKAFENPRGCGGRKPPVAEAKSERAGAYLMHREESRAAESVCLSAGPLENHQIAV